MRRDIESGLRSYINGGNIGGSIYDCIYSKTGLTRATPLITAFGRTDLKIKFIRNINEYLLNLLLFIYDKKGTITLEDLISFINARWGLVALYERYAPGKLDEPDFVNSLLRKWGGRHGELLRMVRLKYESTVSTGAEGERLFEPHITLYYSQVIINNYAIQGILTQILNTLNTTIAAVPLSEFMDIIPANILTGRIASLVKKLGNISFSDLFKGDISVLSGCIESSLEKLKSLSVSIGGFTKGTKRKNKRKTKRKTKRKNKRKTKRKTKRKNKIK